MEMVTVGHSFLKHSNDVVELVLSENGVTTGEIRLPMQSPMQKDECLHQIRGKYENPLIVYVGDSINDLLALFNADVGIVVGHSKSFARVSEHFGIEIVPLDGTSSIHSLVGHAAINRPFPRLYRATDWSEINDLIKAET